MSDEVDKYCMENGFVFQPSYFKQINRKAKVSDRERAYRYICEYVFLGKLPDIKDDDILADFWDGTYPTLHKLKAMSLSKTGQGNEPNTNPSTTSSTKPSTRSSTSASTKPSTKPGLATDCLSEYGNGNGKGNGYGIGGGEPPISPKGGIAAPSLEEAEEFARAENIRTNVRKFHSYYSARSWTTNGEPIHDWRALLRTWAERDKPDEKPAPPQRKRYDPEPTDRCPLCGSEDITFRHDYGICKGCGKGLNWDYYNREWKEQKE